MRDIESLRREAAAPVIAREADLPSVIDDLSAAFADDVMMTWFLRDDARRGEAMRRLFRLLMTTEGYPLGRIDRPAGGGAAAVWLPFTRARAPPGVERAARHPHHPLRHQSSPGSAASRRCAGTWTPTTRWTGPTPTCGSWACAPEAQGYGVGSRLLKVGTDRLDAAGEPAYLETQTERNIGLYRRHGFEVISEHRARADAPPLWSMWREPIAP